MVRYLPPSEEARKRGYKDASYIRRLLEDPSTREKYYPAAFKQQVSKTRWEWRIPENSPGKPRERKRVTPAKRARVEELIREGRKSPAEIAEEVGISQRSVYKINAEVATSRKARTRRVLTGYANVLSALSDDLIKRADSEEARAQAALLNPQTGLNQERINAGNALTEAMRAKRYALDSRDYMSRGRKELGNDPLQAYLWFERSRRMIDSAEWILTHSKILWTRNDEERTNALKGSAGHLLSQVKAVRKDLGANTTELRRNIDREIDRLETVMREPGENRRIIETMGETITALEEAVGKAASVNGG